MLSSEEEVPIYAVFTAIVRDFRSTDLSFIMKTWLRAHQQEYRYTHKTRYYRKQQELVRRLCTREDSRIAVVCDKDSPDFVVGFAVATEPPGNTYKPLVVHYVYVKADYRKQGFATMMLRALGWIKERPILATHWFYGLHKFKEHFDLQYDDWILKGIYDLNDYQ